MSKYREGQLLLIDKPYKWTSFDVVNKLRHALKVKKAGHGGTLDPLATGLLLIGTGKYTKQLMHFQSQDKQYEGVIEIGKTTPSYDLETDFETQSDFSHITERDIMNAAETLTGRIEQLPPAFSAAKVNGVRAYKLARGNKEAALKSRVVHVYVFTITHIRLPEVSFIIHCSKGTYIRTIANDFGKLLGVGAFLKSLRRTAVGEYRIEQAETLDNCLLRLKSEHENN